MSSGRRVLLLEDHDDSRELMAALLRRSGFDVVAYDRCEPAEVHLGACDFDIALLDVRMPERCGDDFGRELRARCPRVMIVFVTGEARVDALKAAVPDCHVMRKPVDAAVLLELMNRSRPGAGDGSPTNEPIDDGARPGEL